MSGGGFGWDEYPAENPYCVSIDTTVEFNRNSIEYYCVLYRIL